MSTQLLSDQFLFSSLQPLITGYNKSKNKSCWKCLISHREKSFLSIRFVA